MIKHSLLIELASAAEIISRIEATVGSSIWELKISALSHLLEDVDKVRDQMWEDSDDNQDVSA